MKLFHIALIASIAISGCTTMSPEDLAKLKEKQDRVAEIRKTNPCYNPDHPTQLSVWCAKSDGPFAHSTIGGVSGGRYFP